jgi:hypothetical protein
MRHPRALLTQRDLTIRLAGVSLGALLALGAGAGIMAANSGPTATPSAAVGVSRDPPDQTLQVQAPDRPNQEVPSPHQWTRDEFGAHVHGKTKAQIRAEFGSPDSSDGDKWEHDHLDILDVDAGTHAHTAIIRFFETIGDHAGVVDSANAF